MYYDFLKSGQCVIIILISKSFLSILFLNGLDFFLRNTVQIKSIERLDLCLIVSVPCVPTASNRYETISASEASSCGHRRYVVFVVLAGGGGDAINCLLSFFSSSDPLYLCHVQQSTTHHANDFIH